MVETTQQETAQQHMDLANWRMLMEQKFAAQDEQIRALTEQQSSSDNNENRSATTVASMSSMSITKPRDEDLGVTSTFSYSSTTPLVNQCAQPLNLRQTDRETSAI